jgi:hypothetical protein
MTTPPASLHALAAERNLLLKSRPVFHLGRALNAVFSQVLQPRHINKKRI